ncbi:helix-turn-helix domain-containing protein [Geomonas sp. Red32]|uniref:helix-turn-helix transcriptional regulator n=1 Tax=Geomonas sp. Red32 TaxID=2912856 RepID=UPI00202CF4D8|nr:helix-turn-helix transcriptional regulator [Geomonas sp. Red32]MCM0080889.1 helix-turn-helix domain-containing protein [Geomonas sp. Red32]
MDQASDRPDRTPPPSVAIDGTKIRNVRETKKLTQLYVASVVGVTTDTISRWENNRYPTIKRDNAEKLAQALEVELEEILRQEEPAGETPPPPLEPARDRQLPRLLLGAVLVAVLVAGYLFTRRPAAPPVAVRWAPSFAAPGELIPVQIKVSRPPGEPVNFIVKESAPAGFRIFSSMPATSATGTSMKWLVPHGNSPVVLSYTVRVPDSPLSATGRFKGEIVIRTGNDTRTEAIGGSDAVRIGYWHWADTNGDGVIDDNEIMPAYFICEDMKGLGLDWKTIEDIWNGKGYRWDRQKGFMVVK